MHPTFQTLSRKLPLFGGILAIEGLLGFFPATTGEHPTCSDVVVHYPTVFSLLFLGFGMMIATARAPGKAAIRIASSSCPYTLKIEIRTEKRAWIWSIF